MPYGANVFVAVRRRVPLTRCFVAVLLLLAPIPPACAIDTLTLMTYNIHSAIPNGGSLALYQAKPSDVKNIADVITSGGADLAGLQEVRSDWKLADSIAKDVTPLDIAKQIAGILGGNFVFGSAIDDSVGHPPNTGYLQWGSIEQWTNNGARHGEYGNAVWSRMPLVTPPTNLALPSPANEEQRACLRVQLAEPVGALGTVVVYNAHLQHNNAVTRQNQMREILRHASREVSTATVFIMGDLNHSKSEGETDLLTIASKAGFRDLAADFAEKTGDTPGNTIPAALPLKRIDYILCSKAVSVTDVRVIQSLASDHLSVVARIRTDKLE